jgi:hypothetical protein
MLLSVLSRPAVVLIWVAQGAMLSSEGSLPGPQGHCPVDAGAVPLSGALSEPAVTPASPYLRIKYADWTAQR